MGLERPSSLGVRAYCTQEGDKTLSRLTLGQDPGKGEPMGQGRIQSGPWRTAQCPLGRGFPLDGGGRIASEAPRISRSQADVVRGQLRRED